MSRALRGETVRDVEMILVGKSGQRRTMTVVAEQLLDAAASCSAQWSSGMTSRTAGLLRISSHFTRITTH